VEEVEEVEEEVEEEKWRVLFLRKIAVGDDAEGMGILFRCVLYEAANARDVCRLRLLDPLSSPKQGIRGHHRVQLPPSPSVH